MTKECSVCEMHFLLVVGGNLIRLHNNQRGQMCPGSLRPPAEEKQYYGWFGGVQR